MSRPGSVAPPALTRRWLGLVLPKGVVGEAIRGDLDEEFRDRARTMGGKQAARWYRRQARRVVIDYLVGHRARSRTRPPGAPGAPAPRRGLRGGAYQVATDSKLAFRAAHTEPGLFLTVIIILALGIGANTAVYSVVQAVLLEPLPYPEPDRVVHMRQTLADWRDHSNPILARLADDFPVEWGVLRDWERLNQSFESIGVYREWRLIVSGPQGPHWIDATQASAGAFAALGVRPALGRLFGPEDDLVGGERTVIVSDGFWRNTLGADPEVVGSTVRLSDVPHRVIGVMPAGFYFPTRSSVLWTRLQDRYLRVYAGAQVLHGLGRLRPGTTLEAARRDMAVVATRINETQPERRAGYGVRLWRQHERLVGDVRPVMTLLQAAVGLVLLIACANASGLMLVRATRREREFALRAALGAGRWRILKQVLTESMLLAGVAGAAALVTTAITQGALVAMLPAGTPNAGDIRLDRDVLFFSMAASLISGVMIGALPALRASRRDQTEALRGGGRASTATRATLRAQRLLVVAEVALAVPLIVGAGLLVGSLTRLTAVDLGFDPADVLSVGVGLAGERYDTETEVERFHDDLRSRLLALPGIERVAGGQQQPFGAGGYADRIRVGDGDNTHDTNVKWAGINGDFFALFQIPIRAGRVFSPTEVNDAASVAVINEAMARQFWPDSDPIGEVIQQDREEWTAVTIIGVVGDVKAGRPEAAASPLVYFPRRSTQLTFAKAGRSAELLRPALERVVREMDPDVPITIRPMEDLVSASMADSRFRARLISLFAILAGTLALVGVGGMLTYMVTQQRREIGLRMALGATSNGVLRAVLGRGVRLVTAGLLIGATLAAFGVRLIRSFLFETSPADPTILIGAAMLLVAAGLVASLAPARRAARIHPGAVLDAD